jgi:hypothetical protein
MQRKDITDKEWAMVATVRLRAMDHIAKMTGAHLKPNPLDQLPLWDKIRDVIMQALRPFPQAREAVEDAIHVVEAELK